MLTTVNFYFCLHFKHDINHMIDPELSFLAYLLGDIQCFAFLQRVVSCYQEHILCTLLGILPLEIELQLLFVGFSSI